MDLALNETEEMLRDSARSLLERLVTPQLLAELEADGPTFSDEVWRRFADLGWTAIALAGAASGDGAGLVALGVLLEEVGAAALASPLLTTSAAGLIVDRAGSTARAKEVVEAIAAGDVAALVAPADPATSPEAIEGATSLRGGPWIVEWADVASVLVCPARTVGAQSPQWTVYAVDPAAPGVRIEAARSFDNERVARVTFDGVPVADADILAAGLDDETMGELIAETRLLRGALLVGTARRMLELTLEHVRERRQFGVVLGSFQAVQHKCADVAMLLESARLAVFEGLSRADAGLPAAREAAVATYAAGEAAARAAVESAQLHGGVGFITEYPLHFYFRRAKAMQLRLGAEPLQLELVARSLVDGFRPGWEGSSAAS